MLNIAVIILGGGGLAWILFLHHSSANKTLNASRWMLLAWGLLGLVHLFFPLEFLFYRLSAITVLYCLLWVMIFVSGDWLGARLHSNRGLTERPQPARMREYGRITLLLIIGAVAGMVYLGNSGGKASIIAGGVRGLADLRDVQVTETGGLPKTVAIVLACGGLAAFVIDLSSAILSNRKIRWFSTLGFVAYSSIYILAAGRSGLILGGGCLVIATIASLQLLRQRYRWWRRLLLLQVLVIALALGYFMAIVAYRWDPDASMDKKITYMNTLHQSQLDDEFRESVHILGPMGDSLMESFYYLAPQLYGLEHSLNYYDGRYGWGAVQFPYFARRIEQLFDVNILEELNTANERSFDQWGLFSHFFATAVQTTFMDFGLLLALPFVGLCGFLAGKSRVRALRTRSPHAIALQSLICIGAAWTIIFSPFAEGGWAFPLLWFLGIIFLPKHAYVVPPKVNQVLPQSDIWPSSV